VAKLLKYKSLNVLVLFAQMFLRGKMRDNYTNNKSANGNIFIKSYDQANYLNDIKPKNRPDLYKMLNKQREEKIKDRNFTSKIFGLATLFAALILVIAFIIK